MTFEFITEFDVEIKVVWEVIPRILENVYRRFGGVVSTIIDVDVILATGFSETSLTAQQTTRYHLPVPQDRNIM